MHAWIRLLTTPLFIWIYDTFVVREFFLLFLWEFLHYQGRVFSMVCSKRKKKKKELNASVNQGQDKGTPKERPAGLRRQIQRKAALPRREPVS